MHYEIALSRRIGKTLRQPDPLIVVPLDQALAVADGAMAASEAGLDRA
jgi:hypothetical protein